MTLLKSRLHSLNVPTAIHVKQNELDQQIQIRRKRGILPIVSTGSNANQIVMRHAFVFAYPGQEILTTSPMLADLINKTKKVSRSQVGDMLREIFMRDGTIQIGSEFRQAEYKVRENIDCQLATLERDFGIDDLEDGLQIRNRYPIVDIPSDTIRDEIIQDFVHITQDKPIALARIRNVILKGGREAVLNDLREPSLFRIESRQIDESMISTSNPYDRQLQLYRGGQLKLLWSTQPEILAANPDLIIYVGGAPGDWVNHYSKSNFLRKWVCIDRQIPQYPCQHISEYVTPDNASHLLSKIPDSSRVMIIWDVRKLRPKQMGRDEWNEVVSKEYELAKDFLKVCVSKYGRVFCHLKLRPEYQNKYTRYIAGTAIKLQAFNRLDSHETRCVGWISQVDDQVILTQDYITNVDESFNRRRDLSYSLDLRIVSMRLQEAVSIKVTPNDSLHVPSDKMVALFSLSNAINLDNKDEIFRKISQGAVVTLEYGGLERQGQTFSTIIDGRDYRDFSVDILDDVSKHDCTLQPLWHFFAVSQMDYVGDSLYSIVLATRPRHTSEQETSVTTEMVKAVSAHLKVNYFNHDQDRVYTVRKDVIDEYSKKYGIVSIGWRGDYRLIADKFKERRSVSGHLLYVLVGACLYPMGVRKYVQVIINNSQNMSIGTELKNLTEDKNRWHYILDYILATYAAETLLSEMVTGLTNRWNVDRCYTAIKMVREQLEAYLQCPTSVPVVLIPALGGKSTLASKYDYLHDIDYWYEKTGFFAKREAGMTEPERIEAYEHVIDTILLDWRSMRARDVLLCHTVSQAQHLQARILGAFIPTKRLRRVIIRKERPPEGRIFVSKLNIHDISEVSHHVYDTFSELETLIVETAKKAVC
ncbi:guanylytransferase [Carcinus maenas reovirus]|nr:guanylytransferase [Carcinus maenas reovirus]